MKKRRGFFIFGFALAFVAASAHADRLDGLAKKLASGASPLKNKKIAVLAFPYHDGKISSGSTLISERLTTLLVERKGVRVIERRLIEQLLTEKKLDETGIVSQENLKSIGSVLDADAIVTGTLIDLDNGKTEINARLIRTDSGEVLSAGQETIARTWPDAPAMPREEQPAAKVESAPERADKEAMAAPRMPPAATPSAFDGAKSLHLTNESFPEGRRVYHADSAAGPNRKSAHPNRDERMRQREDENYDSGYDEGYNDARRESLTTRPRKEAPPPPPPDRPFDHPTKIGTVR